jgi:hypothetical protein
MGAQYVAIAMVLLLVFLIVFILLLGRFYPGSGAEQLDWASPQALFEKQVQGEMDDLDQMLEAANERRRRKGRAEITEDALRADVAEGEREIAQIRERHLAEQDIEQMLAVKNERRRRKGLRELTVDEYRKSIGG